LIYQLYLYQINNMKSENPTGTVLYSIEKTIKAYRKISQKHISNVVNGITVDQCLVLIILEKNSTFSQNEIAALIFKDAASITRIIELMVNKGYLKRAINNADRRKFNLEISTKGRETIKLLTPVIEENRKRALRGLSKKDLEQLDNLLHKIIANCSNE
jgi:DNA-binding MarR family transcriptional regulator